MVTLNTIKESGLATAAALGGAASLIFNNSIGAAVHAIVETNQYLKKPFQSPLLRAAVAAGVGAAAYLQPRAVTAGLIALSALKFGVQALNQSFPKAITPPPLGSKANPLLIDENSEVGERFTPERIEVVKVKLEVEESKETAEKIQRENEKFLDEINDHFFNNVKPSATLNLKSRN